MADITPASESAVDGDEAVFTSEVDVADGDDGREAQTRGDDASAATAPPEVASRSSRPSGSRGLSLVGTGGATGRRKEAIARVRLRPGTGQWQINGRSLSEYFPNRVHQQVVAEPFTLLELDGRYDVIARLHGGGISGQAGALRLGIARALNEIDEENNRPALKKAGLLTRDARATERKKYGLKKARKAPQYSKR